MRTIWKFPLRVEDYQTIEVPDGAEFLAAQMQDETLMLWALVEPQQPLLAVKIAVHGTGHPIPDGESYIGTAQMMDGRLVWHVFEVL